MEEEKQSYRIKLGYTPTLVKIIRLCALSKTTSQTLNVLVRNRSSLLYYSVRYITVSNIEVRLKRFQKMLSDKTSENRHRCILTINAKDCRSPIQVRHKTSVLFGRFFCHQQKCLPSEKPQSKQRLAHKNRT